MHLLPLSHSGYSYESRFSYFCRSEILYVLLDTLNDSYEHLLFELSDSRSLCMVHERLITRHLELFRDQLAYEDLLSLRPVYTGDFCRT